MLDCIFKNPLIHLLCIWALSSWAVYKVCYKLTRDSMFSSWIAGWLGAVIAIISLSFLRYII